MSVLNYSVLVCTRDRPLRETTDCLRALGRPVYYTIGVTDVTLARNIALTGYLEAESELSLGVLLVDDDIVFTRETAARLVEVATDIQHPASAVYGTTQGTFCASRFGMRNCRPTFLTGLGFTFFPRALLRSLADTSKRVLGPEGKPVREFTRSCAGDVHWLSEDYYLCSRVGGVYVEGMVGHRKVVTIVPDPRDYEILTQWVPSAAPSDNKPIG